MVVNRETQSNHQDMLQSPTLVVGEKKDNKLDSSSTFAWDGNFPQWLIGRGGWNKEVLSLKK